MTEKCDRSRRIVDTDKGIYSVQLRSEIGSDSDGMDLCIRYEWSDWVRLL